MTTKQAEKILLDAHICPKHGVRMYQGYDAAALGMIGIEAEYHCYRCDGEEAVAEVDRIAQAKSVLGLK